MSEATFTFPNGFLWGTATSSHQVEGNNTNNDWFLWEQEGHVPEGHTSAVACDWWSGKWQQDFDRAMNSGQNAHRLSIEWSRVQPAHNHFDDAALDFYREMVRGLRQRGIQPMVTLHHFTNPIWLHEMHGWENDDVIDYFQEYTFRVINALSEFVDLWITINEPNILAFNGFFLGDFPPGEKSYRSLYQSMRNMVKAHAAAYQQIHRIQPNAKVGLANHYRGVSPSRDWFLPDRWTAKIVSTTFNNAVPNVLHTGIFRFLGTRTSMPKVKGTQDFFGLNYYTREYVSFAPFAFQEGFTKRRLNPEAGLSPTRFIANEPTIFFQAIKWAKDFDLPIYITENGIEDSADEIRPQYLIEHLHQMWRGINFNWPVRGYFHWTLVDNFEWERGWTQRFGLWELDLNTQVRTPRRSTSLFEAICHENALTSDHVSLFAPTLKQKMFP